MTKICSKCRQEKPLEEFDRNKNLKLGRDSSCKPCRREVKKASLEKLKAENPELWQERQRRYRESYKTKHPERVREQYRKQNLKSKFNLSIEEYEAMLAQQGGKCAVCGTAPGARRLAVDHDRACCPGDKSCGKCIRKLLCGSCNTALGLLKDNLDYIKTIYKYVEAYK